MRSLPHLTRLFRGIVSLCAASGAVVACSSSSTADPPADGGAPTLSRDGFDQSVCVNGRFNPTANITPKVPVDYISFANAPPSNGSSSGTPCATAKDATVCKTKLDEIVAAGGGSIGCGQTGCAPIVYTRGDEVGALRTRAEVVDFLSFRSVADAALIASVDRHVFSCAENNARATASGYELITRTGDGCGAQNPIANNRVLVSKAGDLTIQERVVVQEGNPNCSTGRRPQGLCASAPSGSGLGRWLAEVAHLEAASVVAFERLACELEALGAPPELVAMARESAEDEVRHARVTSTLARRYDGVVDEPRVDDVPRRSLFEIARENMVEGCVRETYGALVATFQMEHAEALDLRAAMKVIAADETKHSALSWEIAAWADTRLSEEERARIAAARDEAVEQLRREVEIPLHADVHRLGGMPSPGDACRMFEAAARELWAA